MKLKELRKENKLSQYDLANIISTSQQNYNRYENGKVEPDLKTLIKLANYYNVSLDYLCGRQWNNQIGYIPENKKNTIQKLLELDDMNFERVDTYINARFEVQEEQHNIKKAEE